MVVSSNEKQRVATTTAGLRGTEWRGERLPSGVQITVHPLRTADGASVTGYLFRRGGERTVVCSMHPRELVVANYLVPEILLGNSGAAGEWRLCEGGKCRTLSDIFGYPIGADLTTLRVCEP